MRMNQKEILLREMLKRVGDRLDEEIVAEKVNHFIKYGTVFLLFEVMNLRKEIERIKEEISAIWFYPFFFLILLENTDPKK